MWLPPRLIAVLTVFLLIGSMALTMISGVSFIGTYINGDRGTKHDAGKIVNIDGSSNFSLRMANGQVVHFVCSTRCKVALHHIQRHKQEHAATDVYYVKSVNGELMALDVD